MFKEAVSVAELSENSPITVKLSGKQIVLYKREPISSPVTTAARIRVIL